MADPTTPRATRSQTTPQTTAPEPILCANGCGFFGRPDQRNLCSKCHAEVVKREQQAPVAPVAPAAESLLPPAQLGPDTSAPVLAADAPADDDTPSKDNPKKRNRHRCGVCRKKLRLAQQFECHCEETFCGEHRYGDAHDCQFDYIKRNQDQLRKDNPEVVASKLSKI